ncbi:tyrosine-type recombinase/integrase [Xenorhabdus thuongxuanensis]|uniref:tyrosine-type recombinase/integrase n=1 Tax=Xenorhabdus thuongxuanensis TaxID=1873484 RepID=UPI0039EF4C0A
MACLVPYGVLTASNGLRTQFYSPGGFGQIWNFLIKRSGVRHRKSYQTRHTYACWMLSAGANPSFIATQMGHVSSQMVHSVYGAWMSENSDDQIKLLNERLAVAPYVPQVINGK